MDITFALRTFITFFTVIDPLGLVPVTLVILANHSDKQRKQIITRAIVISALVITVFALLGKMLIQSLGIGLYAFNIAGGILLFLISLEMLFGRTPETRETDEEEKEAISKNDVSVFPLAIPMIAGPGTIATTILFANSASSNIVNIVVVIAAIIFCLLVAWFAMEKSSIIMKLVSRTGIFVFSRILGILLAALAVQFILNGIQTYLKLNGLI
jgi:multiple antibiotic resistance protein